MASLPPTSISPCPDENALLAFLEGRLSGVASGAIQRHIDRCGSCGELLGALGHLQSDRPASAPPPGAAAPYRRNADRIGQVVGRYRIEGPLGRGGMGEIYRAHDPTLGRDIALKLVRREQLARHGEAAADRLLREARAMAMVAHPNVVPVHDAGLHDGEVFIAMELVVGETLAAWLCRERRPWRQIVEIFIAAGEGLDAAHRAGVLHRDFKPLNVLIGSDERPRVTDFGLAWSDRGQRLVPGQPREEDGLAGTPAYMAPEQLVGAAIDARADQFAFCVSLHEALLGRRPYEGSSSEEIRANMMQRRRVPIGASCPAEVRKVLERGLEVDPQMRFASLGDLLDELRLAVAHEGELHIQVHTACQAFFAVMHVLSSLCLAHDITGSPRETAASAAPTVSSDATAGQLLLGFIGIAWGTTVLTFLVSGVIWAAVNALGLWRRQAWARKSTMIYAVMGIASLIGIPYAIYALWSLRLPGVKGAFELAARRRR